MRERSVTKGGQVKRTLDLTDRGNCMSMKVSSSDKNLQMRVGDVANYN